MTIQSARVQKALAVRNQLFKRLFGVTKKPFYRMLEVLQRAFEEPHKSGGQPPTKLQVEDRLLLTLQYYRESRTMEHLGYEYDVVVSAVHSTIEWVENVLIRDGTFSLPGKKTLIAPENTPRTVVVDVTESPIERPKKNRKNTIPARRSVTP